MKIKSLLLGSAAAMIAVSGAQAADAIVIEAEPMEYVKVCDMYGAGFFYIPGTETCMNINGYVRSTYSHKEVNVKTNIYTSTFNENESSTFSSSAATNVTTKNGFISGVTGGNDGSGVFLGDNNKSKNNASSWTVRGRINFDVRNETEYGTLRSELRLQAGDTDGAGDANVTLDRALIHLAGFRLGYSDTYWTTNHGYGAGSPAINDGYYNYDQAIFFDYTAQLMDGLSVTVGVQDSEGGSFGASSPDFYAGMNWSLGDLTIAATAIYDDYIDINSGKSKDEWAYKVSGIWSMGDSGWQLGGWYAKDDGHTQYVSAISRDTDEEWGVQVNGALTSNLSLYGLYTEASGELNLNVPGKGTLDADEWSIGTVWAPVSGLTVQLEYTQSNVDLRNKTVGSKWSADSEQFQVRVTRSF